MSRLRAVSLLLLLLTISAAAQQGAPPIGEWRRTGGDGNTRYSPLDQINAANVKDLKIAWTWKSSSSEMMKELESSSPWLEFEREALRGQEG